MQDETLTVEVECRIDARGEPVPVRFGFGARAIAVEALLDAWLAPAHRYFKLRGDDGALYILREDVPAARWTLTMYDRTGAIG